MERCAAPGFALREMFARQFGVVRHNGRWKNNDGSSSRTQEPHCWQGKTRFLVSSLPGQTSCSKEKTSRRKEFGKGARPVKRRRPCRRSHGAELATFPPTPQDSGEPPTCCRHFGTSRLRPGSRRPMPIRRHNLAPAQFGRSTVNRAREDLDQSRLTQLHRFEVQVDGAVLGRLDDVHRVKSNLARLRRHVCLTSAYRNRILTAEDSDDECRPEHDLQQ